MTDANTENVPEDPPGLTSSRAKIGRPSNAERRAKLIEELQDLDLVVAEEALRVVRDRNSSPSVKIQGLQLLQQTKDQADAGDATEPGECMTQAMAVIEAVAKRARALQSHYGRPITELLGSATDEELRDSRVH